MSLIFGVYNSFHQTIKYGHQRNHILQDLTGYEIKIYMKAGKTKTYFETGFRKPKTSLPKKTGINTPKLNKYYSRTVKQNHTCIQTSTEAPLMGNYVPL